MIAVRAATVEEEDLSRGGREAYEEDKKSPYPFALREEITEWILLSSPRSFFLSLPNVALVA
jgi:hypothetical protein